MFSETSKIPKADTSVSTKPVICRPMAKTEYDTKNKQLLGQEQNQNY